MSWDLHDFRLVTVSAYPGMMAPLTTHPSAACVLSGDADNDGVVTVAKASLESLGGIRRRWRFGDVAGLADFVPKVLSGAWPDPRPLLLISPRINRAWEAAAASWPAEPRMIGRLAFDVNRVAEDKVFVRDQLRRQGLPVPPSVTIPAPVIRFAGIADSVGTPFVVQSPNSAGGQGTYLVATEADLVSAVSARPDVDRWLASGYAGDVTINVGGIVYTDGVEILPASTQSSAIEALGVGFGAYCGSDFAAPNTLAPAVLAEAHRHAATVGGWLRTIGHRGLFGVDIAVRGDALALLEVNPRIQGSSWLLDRLLRRSGQDGCLERHVQALLGRPVPAARARPVPAGSHAILRWSGQRGVVRSLPCLAARGDIVVAGLPAVGTAVMPGAIIARLESSGSLTSPAGDALTPAAAALVAELSQSLEVTGQLTASGVS